ncbi:hypothetical protein BJ322DRAFT_1110709 [Thelephora terrestris]|uniref:Uncharacterized protein n=1 Tax=Thelephora terrestris TaxID=56493 RepID=A0A9P6HAE3_9AGAM|nr:hypothetical protein BJ322DRAFT_1110709 [Thelephora terrestris]
MTAPNKTKTTSTKDPQNNKLKTTSGNVRTSTEITVSRDSQITLVEYSPGKPDKAAYNQEQEKIKAEIEPLQVKLNSVKGIISLANDDSRKERKLQIKGELEVLRNQQSDKKFNRGKVIEQLGALQGGIQKQIKDLNASKAKAKLKSVEEVDVHISDLERQVESRKLTLGDEKRAVQEISNLRRLRRIVEGFQSKQAAIDHERKQEAQLQAQLDDPEAKAISERYVKLKAELDEIKRDCDEAFANRSKLFGEKNSLQKEIDALWSLKKESQQRFKDANDRYWTEVKEDRANRAKAKAEDVAKIKEDRAKAENEDQVKKDRMQREERTHQQKAAVERQKLAGQTRPLPAHQTKIKDRQTPIDAFSKGIKVKGALQGKNNALRSTKNKPHQRFEGADERDLAERKERARQRKAAEEQQRLDLVERMQEGVYQIEIQDRQTPIDTSWEDIEEDGALQDQHLWKLKKVSHQRFKDANDGHLAQEEEYYLGGTRGHLCPGQKTDLAGVHQLDIRKVEAPADIVTSLKGEDEEAYFVARKGKKSKKGTKTNGHTLPVLPTLSTSSSHFQVSLPTLTALLSFSVPPPASKDEIPRVVEDLKTKKAWFEANQEPATKEKVAEAEAEIKRILMSVRDDTNGDGEVPVDPASEPSPSPNDIPVER